MKVRTIAMMLTLLVAGLAIGCSSAPEAPAAPVANLTEKEAIGIARSNTRDACWRTEKDYSPKIVSNFTHSESASFKPSSIWIVTAKNSWTRTETITTRKSGTPNSRNPYAFLETPSAQKETITSTEVESCTFAVDDVTGKVTSN